ncbi:MAG: phage tail sheath C-terminal domain-containing protein, partial [Oscillospiraceae bacterium]|nr:phage tail sheath C-terminal domain-containing protein [Oscillospiraceae bacterium]
AVNQSCTYDTYDGAADAYPRLTDSETIAALQAGHLVFTARSGKVLLEQDQNSLVSFTPEKGRAFRKNRVVRVLDQLAEDTRRIFESYYLGKASNSADGRRLYQAELLGYLRSLAEIGALEQPENDDVTVTAGEEPDVVIAALAVRPVDSMEKLYMTVTLN